MESVHPGIVACKMHQLPRKVSSNSKCSFVIFMGQHIIYPTLVMPLYSIVVLFCTFLFLLKT